MARTVITVKEKATSQACEGDFADGAPGKNANPRTIEDDQPYTAGNFKVQ